MYAGWGLVLTCTEWRAEGGVYVCHRQMVVLGSGNTTTADCYLATLTVQIDHCVYTWRVGGERVCGYN